MITRLKTYGRISAPQTLKAGVSGLVLGTLAAFTAYLPFSHNPVAFAAGEIMADYFATPIDSAFSATPLAMLTLSNDHQLYYKAYDDYSDLNGDGALDLTYNHAIEYYGYFDFSKCYSYDANNGYFEPKAFGKDKYCDDVGGEWSGNFLNWASMHRMDVVRRVLYGGKRSTDSATNTVLERAFLPNDAHSSAKYYNGADIAKLTPFDPPHAASDNAPDPMEQGVTICNTTHVGNPAFNLYSQNVDTDIYPPLMRVAQGNYSLWNANERWQCRWSEERDAPNANNPLVSGIPAHDNNPSKAANGLAIDGGGGPDFAVRVRACVENLIGTEDCREYPGIDAAVLKPVGLLQKFGGDNSITFGLITGSHGKNLSGGVLRKNVVAIDNEIDETTGQFTNVDGIVKTLNTFRIYGYNFRLGHYLDSRDNGGDRCDFGLSDFAEGDCSNWGNPQGEIFLEAIRYLKGAENRIPGFQSNDDNYINGLVTAPWDNADLITADNACATLNVVSFNASYASKDGGVYPDLEPAATNRTNTIGIEEKIANGDFFIGENGTDNNQLCTGKTIGAFARARGLCPEAPRVGGSYKIAGVAYDAHVNDQYADVEGTQVIDTYGVTLSPSVPKIVVNVPDSNRVVTILPACRNYNPVDSGNPPGSCTLVDFKVVSQTADSGEFYVNWEDSEAGGDYDQDMWGKISYTLSPLGDSITVVTDVHAKSTPHSMGFGYIIGGTINQDGFHAHSGINNFKYPNRNGADAVSQTDATGVPGCPNDDNPTCGPLGDFGADITVATSHKYAIGDSSAGLLELPLYYAAKWGSFEDKNNNNKPDLQEEWDQKNNFDATDKTPDGMPDNYFLVSNPTQLINSLTAVFEALVSKSARTGAAAAVIANSAAGFGAVFQAQYRPEFQDDDFNTVRWTGDIKGIFIDDFSRLREDSDQDGRLDGYQTDKVVTFEYKPDIELTKLVRWESSEDDVFVENGSAEDELENFKPIWSAGRRLYELTDAQAATQRAYGDSAANGRHILTWMDSGNAPNGKIESTEVEDFVPGSVTAGNFGYFGVNAQAAAQDIVRFIRGESGIGGFRNRDADFDGDGATETYRLSDVVQSPPLPVGPPRNNFDHVQGDPSYAQFRRRHQDRRLVVVSGGNGGLVHAFNGGFFDEQTREYETASAGKTAHPLGAELWAYAPMNLLPHLQWLTDPDYSHVYYVDGRTQVFDMRIFDAEASCPADVFDADAAVADTCIHPGGWGTVLVIGMRLGGGDFEIDHDQDAGTAARTMRSAYVLLDITDPEKPPVPLAEVTHPKLAFTTSTPQVLFEYNGGNKWSQAYLAFGSGPTDLGSFSSTQNAHLFNYDLLNRSMRAGWPKDLGSDPDNANLANSFVGDVTAADFDVFGAGEVFADSPNYSTDAWYFGTVRGTGDAPSGQLYRWQGLGDNKLQSFKPLMDPDAPALAAADRRPNQAFTSAPTLSRDEHGRIWVYAGSGRYAVKDDKDSDHQQSFYGILEPVDADGDLNYAAVSRDDLVDVGDIVVFTDENDNVEDGNGAIQYSDGSDVVIDGETIETFLDLEQFIEENKAGWYHDLEHAGGASPSTRNLSKAGVSGGVLVYTDFTPSADLCEPLGVSALNIVYYKTGTGHPGVLAPELLDEGAGITNTRLELGGGRAMEPVFHSGTAGGPGIVTVWTLKSNLDQTPTEVEPIIYPGSRTSWHEILIND